MSTPIYPFTIKGPNTYNMRPSPQILSGDNSVGPKDFRRRTKHAGAFASVTFNFLEAEYSIFTEWVRVYLLDGHKWFYIQLPSAGEITWHLARFVNKPSSKLNGHRYWVVSVDLEIYNRRFSLVNDPTAVILTSLLYPSVTLDNMDVTHAFTTGEMLSWLPDNLDVIHAVIGGELISQLQTYSYWPAENMDITHAFASGVLTNVLLTYSFWPAENLDVTHSFTAGVLTDVLLVYSNWPVEGLNISHSLTSGVLA